MKVTITQEGIQIDDAPPQDTKYSEEDAANIHLAQSLVWAMGRIADVAAGLVAMRSVEESAAKQAMDAIARFKRQ